MEIAGFKIEAKLIGTDELRARLARLDDNVRKKALKTALNKGEVEILKVARRLVPVSDPEKDPELEAGLLKKALGIKVKTYNSGIIVAIMGARGGFKRNRQTKETQRLFSREIRTIKQARTGILGRLGLKRKIVERQTPMYYAHLAGPGREQTFMTLAAEQGAAAGQKAVLDTLIKAANEG